MIINFSVTGDPVPYLRMTQNQVRLIHAKDHKLSNSLLKKKQQIQRYLDYKSLVQAESLQYKFDRSPGEKKTRVYVVAFFSNKKHGDPDNILKCVLDALFDSDKYVSSCVDYQYDKKAPLVDITIVESE